MPARPLILAVPAALVAVASIAWLASAAAFDGAPSTVAPQLAQAAPPAAMPPAAGGGPDRPARAERTFSPRAACKDRVAGRIGNRAYIKARLELTPEQMTVWSAFEKVADEASAKENAKCAALPADLKARPSFADGLNMREDMMKTRLESIQAVKPLMLALYAALTPEQKAVFERSTGGFGRSEGDRGGPGGPGPGPR